MRRHASGCSVYPIRPRNERATNEQRTRLKWSGPKSHLESLPSSPQVPQEYALFGSLHNLLRQLRVLPDVCNRFPFLGIAAEVFLRRHGVAKSLEVRHECIHLLGIRTRFRVLVFKRLQAFDRLVVALLQQVHAFCTPSNPVCQRLHAALLGQAGEFSTEVSHSNRARRGHGLFGRHGVGSRHPCTLGLTHSVRVMKEELPGVVRLSSGFLHRSCYNNKFLFSF